RVTLDARRRLSPQRARHAKALEVTELFAKNSSYLDSRYRESSMLSNNLTSGSNSSARAAAASGAIAAGMTCLAFSIVESTTNRSTLDAIRSLDAKECLLVLFSNALLAGLGAVGGAVAGTIGKLMRRPFFGAVAGALVVAAPTVGFLGVLLDSRESHETT